MRKHTPQLSETDLSSQQQTSHTYSDPNLSSNLYMTAMNLRNTIRQVKPSLLWPPTAETLNLQEAEKTAPYILYNFLVWIVGTSEELGTEKKK